MSMTETQSPVSVRSSPGAGFRRMTRIGNRVMVPLLRSGVGAHMHDLALLSLVGRRTGATYTMPVGIHALDGAHVVLTESGWMVNLRGGADVQVVTEGRRLPMHAELLEDADEVATIYGALLRRVGLRKAARVGLRVSGDRMPTHDELVAAIGGHRAVVRLTPR